ncbi:cytochrome P450 [Altericroceibacterium spongiae]|uniref:Cytochrome P450 n=2 Tax=Altericroceibacterium spongiae TaxID=2320269 RepID=A0A420EAJ2_9SPHN|nr:cytochrome P450 [Altericroceibacterium spongiae]
MTNLSDVPVSDIDLYSDEVLSDPYESYRTLRDAGSAVYLERFDVWFIGRFKDVRKALSDWQTFSSDKGIGLNPIINEAWDEALICQDPPVHTERRKMINEVLGPVALKPLADTIDGRAEALSQRLVDMQQFDAVADFAHDLPIGVVMDLIGWPEDVRPSLLKLAEGSWNAAGPDNARMRSGLATLQEMMELITEVYDNNRAIEGGFASRLIEASHQGAITRETAIGMLAGYIVAAFETTISAMASSIWLFADNPDEWNKLRSNPKLAVSAANEIVRIESPLQNFSRWCSQDAEMSDGTVIPAGSRVIVSYASANRDDRQFAQPDRFIIDRKEKMNLGFGHGPHGCAGQGLARMELTAVFTAMAEQISGFEITGQPVRALNNISRAFRSLPANIIK